MSARAPGVAPAAFLAEKRLKIRDGEDESVKTMKGPGLYLAQFTGDEAPFNSWDSITTWAAGLGYLGVQVPAWDGRLIDLKKAA